MPRKPRPKARSKSRLGVPKKSRRKALKTFDELGLTPIRYDDLRSRVFVALKAAGFDWLTGVELASMPLQNPNWRVLRIQGVAPGDKEWVAVLTHPCVIELQKQYALLPASSGRTSQ